MKIVAAVAGFAVLIPEYVGDAHVPERIHADPVVAWRISADFRAAPITACSFVTDDLAATARLESGVSKWALEIPDGRVVDTHTGLISGDRAAWLELLSNDPPH